MSKGLNMTPNDLMKINKVINKESQTLNKHDLERLDKVVSVLGLDQYRECYFKNSRSFLPAIDHENAYFTVNMKCKYLNFTLPENVASLKSFKIYKDKKSTKIKRMTSYVWNLYGEKDL